MPFEAEIFRLKGTRKIAIVMNVSTFKDAEDIDYFITNFKPSLVTPQWIVETYSPRNWVEVFYREVKGWLGLKEYQVRGLTSLKRHFILVFCAYTFILWHKLTGGLRRRWANKLPTDLDLKSRSQAAVHSAPLDTFPEAKTVISYSYILRTPILSLAQNREMSVSFCRVA